MTDTKWRRSHSTKRLRLQKPSNHSKKWYSVGSSTQKRKTGKRGNIGKGRGWVYNARNK